MLLCLGLEMKYKLLQGLMKSPMCLEQSSQFSLVIKTNLTTVEKSLVVMD